MNFLSSAPTQGFPNLGNTCWLNSLLQTLIHNDLFAEMIKRLKSENGLTNSLKHFYVADINPVNILSYILNLWQSKIGYGIPQDSHEAVLWLLEELHGENKMVSTVSETSNELTRQLAKYNSNTTSSIYQLFQGVMTYTTSDGEVRYEPFITFFLDCPARVENFPINITDCFALTFERKKIVHMPGILLVCFERQDQGEFDLTTYFELEDPNNNVIKFRLTGVVLHYGNQYGGHYIAFSDTSKGWLLFDDQNVRPLNTTSSKVRGTPRLMVYERLQ